MNTREDFKIHVAKYLSHMVKYRYLEGEQQLK